MGCIVIIKKGNWHVHHLKHTHIISFVGNTENPLLAILKYIAVNHSCSMCYKILEVIYPFN